MTYYKKSNKSKNTMWFIIGTIIIVAAIIWVILSFDNDSSDVDNFNYKEESINLAYNGNNFINSNFKL